MEAFILEEIDRKTGYKSIIESLLFVWGEPLSCTKIAKILEIKPSTVEHLVHEMMKQYEEEQRGIQIIEVNRHYQLASRKENYAYIEKMCVTTKNKGLSNSALEVLAVIAYQQPITKLDIEQIRGVNCDSPLQHLIDRGLVQILGKLEKIGRPQIYGTTDMFLKSFGLKTLSELPSIEEFGGLQIFSDAFDDTEDGSDD